MRSSAVARTAAIVALLLPAAAAGHAGLSPGGLVAGTETRLSIEIPNEREGHVTTSVRVTVPEGISIVGADPVSGWSAETVGGSVSWTGGRIEGETVTTFFVRLLPSVDPGTYALSVRQGYDDERSVDTEATVTVLPGADDPAPAQHLGRALAAAVVGVLLVVVSLLVALRRRRNADREA